jgi:hypothetical protein
MSPPHPGPFYTRGALPADSPVYVEREADRAAGKLLEDNHYLMVIEPRQQGKTSFLYRLMGQPGFSFCYADLTSLDTHDEARWCQSLCKRLAQHQQIPPLDDPRAFPAGGRDNWFDFLHRLAERCERERLRLVLILDEVGAAVHSWAQDLFAILRVMYNQRNLTADECFKHVGCILCGAYNPRDLIPDPRNSPFNVATPLRLKDFTREQVERLLSHLRWPEEDTVSLAGLVHGWTDGHPYLTQLLGAYLVDLPPGSVPARLDDYVWTLIAQDLNNLPHIRDELQRDAWKQDFLRRVRDGARERFLPNVNPVHAQLELSGVLKADANGFCKVRNRIYEESFLARAPGGAAPAGPAPGPGGDLQLEPGRVKALHEALLAAFTDQHDLAKMVMFELGQHLNHICTRDSLSDAVLDLILWAQTQGRVRDLIRATLAHVPGNPKLRKFAEQVGLDR